MVSTMDDDIENWAVRAAQALQEVVDEAVESSGNETACQDLQDLIAEFDEIMKAALAL